MDERANYVIFKINITEVHSDRPLFLKVWYGKSTRPLKLVWCKTKKEEKQVQEQHSLQKYIRE